MLQRITSDSTLIARFYLFMGATSLGFLVPVWVILLENRGLTFTEITILDSIFFATIILAEVPTGYVGDRIGRRNALIVSSLTIGIATTAFGFLHSFEAFLIDYIVWGVAFTFRSGNDSAWLYDTLMSRGQGDSFTFIRGRGFAMLFGVSAVAALAGGILFEMNEVYPFIATGVLNISAALILLTLPEPEIQSEGETLTLENASLTLRKLSKPPLRAFVLYASVFFAVGWSVNVFIQPVAIRAGFRPSHLGGIYAALTVASAVAANYSDLIERRIGIDRLLLFVPIGLGFLFFIPLALPILAVPLLFLMRMANRGGRPMIEGYLNNHVPSLGRATLLSGFSMVVSLFRVPIQVTSGFIADTVSLYVALAGLGAVLVVTATIIRLTEGPIVDHNNSEPSADEYNES